MLRLGGPVFLGDEKAVKTEKSLADDPVLWAREHREKGFSAAYVPKIDLKDTVMIKFTRRYSKKNR